MIQFDSKRGLVDPHRLSLDVHGVMTTTAALEVICTKRNDITEARSQKEASYATI